MARVSVGGLHASGRGARPGPISLGSQGRQTPLQARPPGVNWETHTQREATR